MIINYLPLLPIIVAVGSILYLYFDLVNIAIITMIFIVILVLLSISFKRKKIVYICIIYLIFFVSSVISTFLHIQNFKKHSINEKIKISIIGKVNTFESGQNFNYGTLTNVSTNRKKVKLKNLKIYTTKKINLIPGTTIQTITTISPIQENIIKNGYKYYLIDMLNNINGIGFITWYKEIEKINNENESSFSISNKMNHLRNIIYDDYKASFKQFKNYKHVDILTALIIAKKNNLPNNIKEYFRNTGTSHIIVISGMHFGIIMIVISQIIRLFFILITKRFIKFNIKKITYIISTIAGFFFLLLCGNSISAKRAFYMFLYHTIGVLLERELKLIYNLCITTTIIMLIQPSNIFDISFQLSSLSVLGICSVEEILKRLKTFKVPNILKSFLYSISIKIITTPIILFTFRNFVPMGMIANYIVTPLVLFIILPINIIYFILRDTYVSIYLKHILIHSSNLLIMIVEFFDHIQLKPILIEQIKDLHIFFMVIFTYTLAIIPFYKTNLKYIFISILFITTLFSFILTPPNNNKIIFNNKKNFMFVSKKQIYSYKIKKKFSKNEREWIEKQVNKNIENIKKYSYMCTKQKIQKRD